MGLDPAAVPHLTRCAERGIGVADRRRIEVRGLQPEDDPAAFLPARHNAVSLVETLLRRSLFKRMFFNTPLFRVCLVGAKLYYRAWTALHAAAHWRRIRSHPVYGAQWSPGWAGPDREDR